MNHAPYVGAIVLVAVLGAGALGAHKEKATPQSPPVVETAEGPRCTVAYPRGFKVAKGTKKRPLNICKDGDLQSTWGKCLERRST